MSAIDFTPVTLHVVGDGIQTPLYFRVLQHPDDPEQDMFYSITLGGREEADDEVDLTPLLTYLGLEREALDAFRARIKELDMAKAWGLQ